MYKKLMQKLSDIEFAQKLISFQTIQEARQFLENEGFDITDEQINELRDLLKKTAVEISDEALDFVAGGADEETMPELTEEQMQELLKFLQDNPDAAKDLMGEIASDLPLEARLMLYIAQAKAKSISIMSKINKIINTPGAKANKLIVKGIKTLNSTLSSWWR